VTSANGNLRSQFLLEPDVIYLNHGGYGACPRPVFDTYQRFQLELERQPTLFFSQKANDLLKQARGRLGAYLHTNPNNLIFVTNATTGVNYVARSLELHPGDQVLTTDQEYGAMDRVWESVCRRAGAMYVRQPIPLPVTTAEDIVETLWRAVTPTTRVIFLSHVTSSTALIFPVAAICQRAREMGILTVIDGAHAPGQVPLDLEAQGADFYTGNCHKWMCAPKGSAFLYVRPEHQPLIEPLVMSWEWADDSDFVRLNQWQGTRDIAPFLAVPAAIEFMETHEWPDVQARCHRLAADIRQRLVDWYGITPLSPATPEWFAQMFTVLLPPGDHARLNAELYEKYRIQLSLGTWHDRLQIRVSVQGYNAPADLDMVFDALTALLPREQ
jgi:isopenicillin-N epimerase